MGTEGILEEVAEPDSGVDLDGGVGVAGVLRRDADAPVRAELVCGGAAVPDGLPEERGAGQGIGDGCEQVHAAGGGGWEGPTAAHRRRDRGGSGDGREAGIPADGRGCAGRHRSADLGDGQLQRPWAAPGDGGGGVRERRELGVLQEAVLGVSGVLRVGVVLGGAKGPGAADAVQAWAASQRAGAGDDLGVQREAGQVEYAACAASRWVAFINEEQTWWEKTFHKDLSRWARVPREREAMHFLIVGDSGTGKSAAIRQLLSQVWERGEAAIVYDPAMEYLPQFYNEARGDVILNPMETSPQPLGRNMWWK